MTIHKDMFDKKKNKKRDETMHRIYVEFEGGYFVTSLDADFNKALQEMVTDLGKPTKVEFRASDEGWISGTNILYDSDPRLDDPDDLTLGEEVLEEIVKHLQALNDIVASSAGQRTIGDRKRVAQIKDLLPWAQDYLTYWRE